MDKKELLAAIRNMNMAEFLAINLPQMVKRSVAVGVSSDEESRKEKDTTQCSVTMVFDTTWTIGDLFDRLMSSNSPKVSVQAVLRKKKDCPKTFTWNVNKSGAKSAIDSREVAIELLMSKGLSREKAEFFIDNIEKVDLDNIEKVDLDSNTEAEA